MKEGSRLTVPAIERVPRHGPLPLSFAQERLWFLHEVTPGDTAYNLVAAIRFRRALHVRALERSLEELVRRHETLRTRFLARDGEPVACIDEQVRVHLCRHDLSSLCEPERAQRIEQVRTEQAGMPFDLASAPLMRATVLSVTDNEFELVLAVHEIVGDRHSVGILARELQVLYHGLVEGRLPSLPELPIQYVDFAGWQQKCVNDGLFADQLTFWRERLSGELPVLGLPVDRTRPAEQTHRGAWESRQLSEAVSRGANALAHSTSATPFMVFLAGFSLLLQRYTGQHEILIGTPTDGRTTEQLAGLVGSLRNMLVLRTDLTGNPTFAQLLDRIREVALDAYRNGEIPFEKLVADLHPRRDQSRSPLFQVALACQSAPNAVEVFGDAVCETIGGTLFDLMLFVSQAKERFVVTAEYNVDLFDRSTVARMLEHFETLLASAVGHPDRPAAMLPMLGAEEYQRIIGGFNETSAPFDTAACVHDLVAGQAARTPDRIAVQFEAQTLTYAELNARANQLAHHLLRQGVGVETPVGIALERTLDLIVGLLGVLKAGAAYVPLDPSYPSERLAHMMHDAGVSHLVTQQPLVADLPPGNFRLVCLDADRIALSEESANDPRAHVAGDNLAYIIYTSGSTGLPKGVQVSHRAVVNILTSMAKTPGFSADDVLVAVTTLSFDIAGLELFLPLTTGGRVVIASREEVSDGGSLRARIEAAGATVMQATPATWRLLLEAGWTGGLRKLFCGGEALPRDLAAELAARDADLWNLYGPTETTIWSTTERMTTAGLVTIGRPIANTQAFVLDAACQPLPIGVPGELYLAGAGVARGYRNRPDLTADRFVPCPFGAAGSRMYRTGDMARYLPDGRLECLGRVDHQVKVRGFRIEPEEIEAVLGRHRAIKEAVVLAEETVPGDTRLIAYIVYTPGESLTVSELRRMARASLPEYMVPSFFAKIDEVPRTLNGKIDRRALPNMFRSRTHDIVRAPATTATERRIAEIWQRALGLASVSVEDNFFDIGGHSLLSMRVLAEIERTLGHRPSPRAMFMENLKQIAEWCDRRLAAPAAAAEAEVGFETTLSAGPD